MAAKLLGERLPLNWSYGVTEDGRIFFIDDSTQQTTWLHPVTGEPVQTGYSTTADEGQDDCDEDMPHDLSVLEVRMSRLTKLPAGWERALTINGTIYFIDHNRHCTTFEHPVTGHSVMDGPAREAPLSPQSLSTPGRKGSGKTKPIKAPTASREENSKVILRGWLHKQDSGGLKLWKKKWCVLADFGLFFYKDEMEGNCIGSILLPSYSISPCKPHDANKKFAFKAEHENMKTFYFAAENQPEMDKWVEALRMAALVQRAPGSGLPKLIPKSPIMSWDDNVDTAGISPPDMQQYPFSGSRPDPRSPGSEHNRSFNDRQPLQARENVQNFSDPYRGQGHDTRSAAEFGTYSRQPQNPMSPNQQFDPRYPSDRMDKTRGSQRSNQSQGQIMPEDQKSMSSQRSNQHFSNTLPRNPRSNQLDTSMRSMGSQQSQGYNSLPRDPRPRVAEGQDIPYSHSSPRQPQSNRGQNTVRQPAQREEKNPYMMMTPHRNDVRKMDPYKNSNRPLPQEPPLEPVHERSRSGGGDYASLSRIRDKKYQQLSEDPGTGERIEPRQAVPNQLSPSQLQRPDLYVDVPHTYVNVYDQSQVRDLPPDLPSRPPLPAEMRPRLVEDIAKTHSPNTQREMIMAERNLELRMKQPSFFNYPTPDREALPKFPQPGDSPRSQTSQRSQRSQKPLLPQQPEFAPNQRKGQGQQKGFQGRSEGMRSGQGAGPIHTVKEEPDMPDSQVIETDLPKRVFPLNGPRLRMSISATDLLGKTHDELVLLLIQLRRDKADLHEQRDGIRKTIEQNRPAEFFYRKLQNEGRPIDPEKEIQHRKYMDMKHKVEDVEKRLEVYKPLVNLVCNMVTMGSLYGGDNLMLATEYRKHLLSPEQYSPPKKMLEFSRRRQEEQIVQEIEEDVRQLTQEQADLHHKELE
ncbi:hypothetical protein DPMN_008526, partial [Dreissena polymorpha]